MAAGTGGAQGTYRRLHAGCYTCADGVNADYQKTMTEMAKDGSMGAPTPEDMKKGEELAKAYGECMAKAMTP